MTPFKKVTISQDEVQLLKEALFKQGFTSLVVDKCVDGEVQGDFFANDKYQVRITRENDLFLHLSIRRLDREPVHDWRELQQIKNELVGEEHEAVELYPAESRLVDAANQYHLYVFAQSGQRFSFGYQERVVSEEPVGLSKQRKFGA